MPHPWGKLNPPTISLILLVGLILIVVRMSTILGDGSNTTGAGNDTSTTQKRKTVRRPVLTLKVDRFVHYTTQVGQAILKQTQLALLLVNK